MKNKILSLYKSDSEAFLREIGTALVMFLCIFISFRSLIADFTVSLIKVLPDMLIVVYFVLYSISVKFRYKFKLCDWLFAGYLAVGLVSTVLINRAGSMGGIYNFVFEVRSIAVYYLLFFVLRNLKLGKDEYCRIVFVMQRISYALLALAVVEKVFNKEILFPGLWSDSIIYADNFARVYSMFNNPNTYGAFIALTLFLSLFKSLCFNEKDPLATYVALILSLLLTMSRSSIIITAVGLLLCLCFAVYKYRVVPDRTAFSWDRLRKILFSKTKSYGVSLRMLCAGVLIVAVISPLSYMLVNTANTVYTNIQFGFDDDDTMNPSGHISALDRFIEVGTDKIIDSSNTNGRLYAVKTGIRVFADHPVFGTGFGTYGSAASLQAEPSIYEKYDIPFPFYADIQYICVLAETGIVGTIVFAALAIALLWNYKKNIFKLFLCLMIAWLGLFYNVLEVQIVAMVFWVFTAFDDRAFTVSEKQPGSL